MSNILNKKYTNEVLWLFKQYDYYKVNYCILRKYQLLPYLLGHDLDIILAKKDWKLNKIIMDNMLEQFDLVLDKKILMPYARRYYFRKKIYSKELSNQLILDYHFDEEWLGAIFLDYDQIPKTKYKSYTVAEEYMEPFLPFLVYLLSTGDILDKYFQQLVDCFHKYPLQTRELLILILGEQIGNYLYTQIYNQETTNIKNIVPRIRSYIWLNSFKKYPVSTVKRFFELIAKIIWYKKILRIYPP